MTLWPVKDSSKLESPEVAELCRAQRIPRMKKAHDHAVLSIDSSISGKLTPTSPHLSQLGEHCEFLIAGYKKFCLWLSSLWPSHPCWWRTSSSAHSWVLFNGESSIMLSQLPFLELVKAYCYLPSNIWIGAWFLRSCLPDPRIYTVVWSLEGLESFLPFV